MYLRACACAIDTFNVDPTPTHVLTYARAFFLLLFIGRAGLAPERVTGFAKRTSERPSSVHQTRGAGAGPDLH